MTKKIRLVLSFLLSLVLGINFILPISAENEKRHYTQNRMLCISYRGDTAEYERNTPEAVMSAFEKGADFVSVNVRKSDDGSLVLCSENETEVKGIQLREMLALLGEDDVLILDFNADLKDDIYELLKNENAFSKAMLRINDSAKNIASWLEGKDENLQVIGVYDSFVVFSAMSHIKQLRKNGMDFVQYQSKNHFNEMFGSLVSKTIMSDGMARAVVSTYDPDLCGQRRDSEDGWNDLIKKGYSVIETNNLNALVSYIKANEDIRIELAELYNKAKEVDVEQYNTISRENLTDAIETAEHILEKRNASSDEMQESASRLMLAVDNLALKTGEDTQKGALNITAGKVIAAGLVGAAILAAQIFIHKMHKEKKRKGEN